MNSASTQDPIWGAVVIRRAVAGDSAALQALAALDSSLPLTNPVLIGELRGEPVAALDLCDGTVVADPFVATAPIVELLRLRARQVSPVIAAEHLSSGGRRAAWVPSLREARSALFHRLGSRPGIS